MEDGGVVIGASRQTDGFVGYLASVDEAGKTRWTRIVKTAATVSVVTAHGNDTLVVDSSMQVSKVGPDGKDKWTRSHFEKLPPNSFDGATAAIVLKDGYVVAGSRTNPSRNPDISAWLLRLDGSGKKKWRTATDGGVGKLAYDAVGRPAGDIVTVGFSQPSDGRGGTRVWVRAWGTKGAKLWELNHGEGNVVGRGIAMAGEELVVAAERPLKGWDHQLWVLRLGSKGQLLWHKTIAIDGCSNSGVRHGGIATFADGSSVLVGACAGSKSRADGLWVLRIDTKGKLLWNRDFGGGAADWGSAIAVADNEFAAVGRSHGPKNAVGILLLRGGSDGTPWCGGNLGAPCKGGAAHKCRPGLTCSTEHSVPMCVPP